MVKWHRETNGLKPKLRQTQLSLAAGILLACALSALSPGGFWQGAAGYTALLVPGIYLLTSAWRWAGGGHSLAWLMAAALLLRLILGVGISLALPHYGYDQPPQKAGYLFRDAYVRDREAFSLGTTNTLAGVFNTELDHDQYGGLAIISALFYKALSPDAHRPFLILTLGALLFTFSLSFFWKAVTARWGSSLASLSAWIIALYPDSLFFTASEMREPFVIGLGMLAFWAVITWRKLGRRTILILAAVFSLMFTISSLITAALAGFLAVWFLLDALLPRYHGPKKWLWLAAAAVSLAGIALVWLFFKDYFLWDLTVTMRDSGWVSKIIAEVGEQWRLPIVTVYGIAQPVLPAAIAEPTLPLWKAIAVSRAAGWYVLAPLLIYGMFVAVKSRQLVDRRLWLWLAAFSLLWLVVSSVRAGGDLWDNPRYRVNFIPLLSLLAGWAVLQAVKSRDLWLVRWLLVEVIFLAYFTNWYFSRYFLLWKRLPFWQMVTQILVLSGLVLASGLLWDAGKALLSRRRHKDGSA